MSVIITGARSAVTKLFIAGLLTAGLGIGLASAGNVHFKQNKKPTFTDLGVTLRAAGTLAGLGNGDIAVFLTATGNPTVTCTNPGTGDHQPPGQKPDAIPVSGSQVIPDSQIKNGNVGFRVTTDPPVSPIPGAPDCPNSNWTEEITDIAFTSATITVEQPAPTVVLTATCTFSPPTQNGTVPSSNVSCQ